MKSLPFIFLDRFKTIIPEGDFDSVLKTFSGKRPVSLRINTLKIGREEILQMLKRRNIDFIVVDWWEDAVVLKDVPLAELQKTDFLKEGYLYPQSLSSMLPVLILDPKPHERILDLCAAPGSKTTQMAALMRNQGFILAVEPIRDRYYKLRSVISQSGAQNVRLKRLDARRLPDPHEFFDKILVDAPCSCEGRFSILEPKTYAYWSLRKIKEMARKQKGILLKATRFLKSGGVLVYSTCTFAPDENEAVVDWLLRKTQGVMRLVSCEIKAVRSYPALDRWQGRIFHPDLNHCLRVLPDDTMEGFFIAKMTKE